MKKLFLFIWFILNILNKIFLIAGIIIGLCLAMLGVVAFIVFIIGLFIKFPNNIKYLGISLICLSSKIIVAIIYSIIQIFIDYLYEKAK